MTDDVDDDIEVRPGVSESARALLNVATTLVGTQERIPLFPSEPEVPRRRRPYDVARLFLTGAGFILLGWWASSEPDLDARVAILFSGIPDWIRTLAWVAYTGSALGALALIGASATAGASRRDVFRDLILALGLAVTLSVVAGRMATGAWPNLLPEFFDVDRPPFPTLRPALVLIVALVLGPYVNAQVQRTMRWLVGGATLAPILLGLTTFTGMIGALTLGVLSVAVVRLVFGSPEGLPSVARLRSILSRVGVVADDLSYLPEQPGTVGLATGRAVDGRRLDIKIYSVDASSRQRAERVWRALWYRRAGPSPRAGRVEQAQHEALAVLVARESGVDVPAPVAVGQDTNGDVLFITLGAKGTPLASLREPGDDDLAGLWDALVRLHTSAHMAHGSISPATVFVHDGHGELTDLADASLFPTKQQFGADVVAMLASQALAVGADRALDLAVEVVDPATLADALPYCQDAVIDPELRRLLGDADIKTDALAKGLAERLEIERPEMASVRRVSWGDLAIAGAGIIAANALISQIADVGFDTLWEELQNATLGWLIVSFIVSIASSTTAYIGLRAVVGRPLPWSPTALLQLAKRFVGLVVPSMVGRVGLDIRFLQKQGVPVAVASTQGPVIGFIGFIAEVTLLLLSSWAIGQTIETGEVADFDGGGLIAIALLVVVVGIIVVVALPRFREKIVPFVRDAMSTIKSIITSPRTLIRIYASEALDRIFGALALAATMAAFGVELPFPALVFVSVGTGLLAGLAPVPGGIGVAEATMTGLLTACGLPTEQAVSIAIVHRVATSYLPPVVGFFSFNWLNREGYL